MRVSEKVRKQLLDEFGNDTLKPITKKQTEWIRKNTSYYLVFDNHDNKHGFCERCESEIEVDKSIHAKEMCCPKCKQKMEVLHKWRRRNNWRVDWVVIPQVIDGNRIVLRYVASVHCNDLKREINELAREVIDFNKQKNYEIEFDESKGGWFIGQRYFFREKFMWVYRRECCYQATEYKPGFFKELRKLDCFKYFPLLEKWWNTNNYVTGNITRIGKRTGLYEKLLKVGLEELVESDWHEYCRSYNPANDDKVIHYNEKETSLMKMLGLNKIAYNTFLSVGTTKALNCLQYDNTLTKADLEMIDKTSTTLYQIKTFSENGTNFSKCLKYCTKNGIAMGEYIHYLDCLKKLNYPLDESYIYPKDFRKEDMRVTRELTNKDYREQDILIAKISKGLREMKELSEFMDGSKGFLVYVPESSWELKNEGQALHNCIGTYVDRIANGKTLVFFVRKLEAPNEPFVAFEYHDGKVVQCRYNHNKSVDNCEILDFVNTFANTLKRKGVPKQTETENVLVA